MQKKQKYGYRWNGALQIKKCHRIHAMNKYEKDQWGEDKEWREIKAVVTNTAS